jgi:hypothetical protein
VEWKKIEKAIREEHEKQGDNRPFGPGLPCLPDGSLLFLLHLLGKMRPEKRGGIFDTRQEKVPRLHQYEGVKAAQERIKSREGGLGHASLQTQGI